MRDCAGELVNMLSIAVFFLLGDLAVQQLTELPGTFQLMILLLLMLVAATRRCWPVVAFCAGFCWTVLVAQSVLADRLARELEGRILTVRGVVADIPLTSKEKTRFDFIPLNPQGGLPEKIRLSWYFPEKNIKAGQIWQLSVKLKRPHGYYNPGGFDYEKWLFSRHIGATGYVKNQPPPRLIGSSANYLLRWRQFIADRLDEAIHPELTRAIVKALLIGDRSDISSTQWEVFRRTGTAHLIAISGLHIGLVSGVVYFLLLRGLLCWPGRLRSSQSIAISVALLAALIYAALAGFSLPTRRALVMLVIVMLALGWRRHVSRARIIAMAMLVILLIDPLVVLSAGFWLSFMAVIVILMALSGRIKKESFYRAAVRVHIVTAVGLTPILALFFNQFSLIAPLANLIAVAVVTLLVAPVVFCILALLFWWPAAADGLVNSLDWILQTLWRYLQWLSQLDGVVYEVGQVGMTAVVFALAGVALLLSPRGTPGRYLGAFMLLPMLYPAQTQVPPGEVRLTLLDVGQGLSLVVETQKHALLFDAGARYNESADQGKRVVLPYLHYRDIRQLDYVIVSHGDNDHIGGIFSVLNALPYSRVLSSVPEALTQFNASSCQAGQQWRWDGVLFRMLSPTSTASQDSDNNRSCVLMIKSRQFRFLLPGDIEQAAEDWLVRQYPQNLMAEVLVAPHHGSKTSSSEELLRQIDADYVLIPAGYRNRFGFPHSAVLQRYRRLGADWLITAETGAVIVRTKNRYLHIGVSRKEADHYWLD